MVDSNSKFHQIISLKYNANLKNYLVFYLLYCKRRKHLRLKRIHFDINLYLDYRIYNRN